MAAPNPSHTSTAKGGDALAASGVGDARVALFFALCRGLDRDRLLEHVGAVVDEAVVRGNDEEAIVDLVLMVFHTRDVREGKGERDLAYWLLLALYERAPDIVLATLSLLPDVYGSWKDVNRLLNIAAEEAV